MSGYQSMRNELREAPRFRLVYAVGIAALVLFVVLVAVAL